jgi:hypothetical protein
LEQHAATQLPALHLLPLAALLLLLPATAAAAAFAGAA